MATERFYADLGAKIRARREAMGLTQAALADEIGISRTSLTNIEGGRQRLLVDQLAQLCSTLSVSPSELVPPNPKSVVTAPQSLSGMPAVASFVESVIGKPSR